MEVLKNYVIYRNRHLSEYVPLPYRQEIYGTALGCTDMHPEEGSYYNRLLNYHAAHDVSYMMIDNPLVSRAGCTSFGRGAAPLRTATCSRDAFRLGSGRGVQPRPCRDDVRAGRRDSVHFVVMGRYGRSGLRDEPCRSFSDHYGAPSSLPRETATPAGMVAREVMQRAHNLTEALDILRSAKVFVSTLWLVGSRADGRFIVVEKSPETTQVREPEGDFIVCANHFQTEALKNEPRSKSYVEESTSVSRSRRMTELVQQAGGRLNASRAADLLRDRNLPGGAFAGNGHRRR